MPVKQVINKGHVPVLVYTDELESSAYDQLVNVSQLPFVIDHIAAMPDVHAGIGAIHVAEGELGIIPGSMGARSYIVRGKDKAVIDEIPAAYKDIDQVMQNQSDLVEIVHTLKQLVCVKG